MSESVSIVVTDRNRHVRDLLQRELSAEGYQVSVAASGSEVLQLLERLERVDLIVLDLDLVGTDRSGPAAEWNALLGAANKPPILVHTFWSDELVDAGGILDQACALVEKSGDLEPLKRMIRRVLRQNISNRGN